MYGTAIYYLSHVKGPVSSFKTLNKIATKRLKNYIHNERWAMIYSYRSVHTEKPGTLTPGSL